MNRTTCQRRFLIDAAWPAGKWAIASRSRITKTLLSFRLIEELEYRGFRARYGATSTGHAVLKGVTEGRKAKSIIAQGADK